MKNFIFLIASLLITGCSSMKGGPCEYQRINGIATIVVNDANVTTAVFQAESNAKKSPLLREGDLYYLHQRVNGHRGSRYPAIMSVITEGSCTPLQLKITGNEILDSKKNDTEKKPGLMWQDQNDTERKYYMEILTYCENLKSAGYDDWRTPKQDEFDNLFRPGFKNEGLFWTDENLNASIDGHTMIRSYPREIRCVRDIK